MQPLAVSKTPAAIQAEIIAEKGLAAKPKAPVVNLSDYFPAAPVGVIPADLSVFRQEWEECATHGRYAANALVNGVECWVAGCPKCNHERRLAAISRQLATVNVPKRFQSATFENYACNTAPQAAARAECMAYAADFKRHREEGNCVVLHGNPGNGKNHLATAIVRTVVEAGYSALIITARDYLEEVWGKDFNAKKAVVAGFAAVDLLVLDEVEKTSTSKSTHDEFFALINARYLAQLPTLLISNLSIRGVEAHIGEMAFDRLRQGDRKAILFNWESWRGATSPLPPASPLL